MTHATETPDELNAALQRLLTYTAKLNLGSKEGGPDAVVDNIIEGIADLERRLAAAEAENGELRQWKLEAHKQTCRAERAESALRSAGERVMEECAKVCDLHARSNWNDDRKAQAKLLADEIRALPVPGEVKINAAPQEKREDAHRADGDGALPESDSPAGAAPTEPPLAGAKIERSEG